MITARRFKLWTADKGKLIGCLVKLTIKVILFFRVIALCIFLVIALCKFGHQKFVIKIFTCLEKNTSRSFKRGQLIENDYLVKF